MTSPTGAAIRDVLHVARRRNPGLEIILAPCRVQGAGAAEEIAAAIRLLNKWNTATGLPARRPLELILVTRGGGSLEDLWAFNEEAVARAIFESTLPVVSAVGHAIDFTISDFVADCRAATPSAAAEIITEGAWSGGQFLLQAGGRMRRMLDRQLEGKREKWGMMRQRLARAHPRRRLNESLQRLDDLAAGLTASATRGIRSRRITFGNLRERLLRVRPKVVLARRGELLRQAERRLWEQAQIQLRNHQNRLADLETRLRLLGPEQVLARGYSITMAQDTGKVIRRADEVKPGQPLKTRVGSGEIRSLVRE